MRMPLVRVVCVWEGGERSRGFGNIEDGDGKFFQWRQEYEALYNAGQPMSSQQRAARGPSLMMMNRKRRRVVGAQPMSSFVRTSGRSRRRYETGLARRRQQD